MSCVFMGCAMPGDDNALWEGYRPCRHGLIYMSPAVNIVKLQRAWQLKPEKNSSHTPESAPQQAWARDGTDLLMVQSRKIGEARDITGHGKPPVKGLSFIFHYCSVCYYCRERVSVMGKHKKNW